MMMKNKFRLISHFAEFWDDVRMKLERRDEEKWLE